MTEPGLLLLDNFNSQIISKIVHHHKNNYSNEEKNNHFATCVRRKDENENESKNDFTYTITNPMIAEKNTILSARITFKQTNLS